jgi:hypothetical protein
MKALTICQPWAHAILHLGKTVENRTWATAYRGPLVIHAGKSRKYLGDRLNDGSPTPPESAMSFGAIVGVVQLVNCLPVRQVDPGNVWAEGPWCWLLADPRPLAQPVPYRGQMGLFDVPDELLVAQSVVESGELFPHS